MTAVFASPPEPGTKPKYPFAEWMDGRWWTLARGRDYWGPTETFVTSLEASARARRKTLTVVLPEHQAWVKIQAVDRG